MEYAIIKNRQNTQYLRKNISKLNLLYLNIKNIKINIENTNIGERERAHVRVDTKMKSIERK